jgi:hypothetical protein
VLEFTTHSKGIEGVLADMPREPLCKVDGEVVTIPVHFPAMAGLYFVSVQAQYGHGAALVWACQAALGSEVWEKLIACGLSDDQLSQVTGIVVARIQGERVPVPQADAPGPKARKPRAPRSSNLKR